MKKIIQNNIDVIIPVYNGEKFILNAIRSIEAQTLKSTNIFVVNDGSTDNTETVVIGYKEKCSIPITYINKENGGPNSARNKGLTLSRADFVAFLDADDIWSSTKLEDQIAIYNQPKFKNLGLVYAGYDLIHSDGTENKDFYIVPLDKTVRGSAFKPLLSGNKVLGSASSVLIKRDVFNTVGFFDEELRFGEDWDMWLRIAESYSIDFVDKKLVHIRRHEGNETNNLDKVFLGEMDFFNKWTKKIAGHYRVPSRWADQIAFHIIIKLSRPEFLKEALGKLSPQARKVIFRQTLGSPILYTLFFIVKKLLSPKEWGHIIKKLKIYG